ncbi:MAG: TerB family tellurite resistance protein, partial [Chitinophagaceae bacterium]
QQLLLDVEKLAQFKQILKDLKEGYDILDKGYSAVKDISKGSFSIHKAFLDALMEVSPAVRNYKRVADIITYQVKAIREARMALDAFRNNNQFTEDEITYLGKIYDNVLRQGVHSIDELAMIITAGKLRMSDDERLKAIDKVYADIIDQYSFLQEFNNNNAILALQRKSEKAEIDLARKLRGF